MEEAENFGDFTERLCNKVCSESTTLLAEYFAYFFAFMSSDFAILETLETAGKIPELAEPLLLLVRNTRGQMVSWDEMRQSLLRALKAAPNDWIACHLYTQWRLASATDYPECDIDVKPIETITKSVSTNKDLEYFKAYLFLIQGWEFRMGGNQTKEIEVYNQALVLARKYDDQILVADLLYLSAQAIKHTDVKQASNLVMSAQELSEHLGLRTLIAAVQHQIGHTMGLRGELDAAIEHQLQCRAALELLSHPTAEVNTVIASHYNQIGDGEKALEFLEPAFETIDSLGRWVSYAHAQKAWALINLSRTDEAKDEIERSKMLATKSGSGKALKWTQIVEAILDKTENHHDSAIHLFQEVLRSIEQDPVPLYQNICLLNLVEIEIERLSTESIDIKTDSSGPWMKKLEEHTQKNDLPGVAARSLILKASLRRKQGRHDEVRSLLKEVLKSAESPSMRYLKDIVVSTFPDVIVT
jgi:tetratricopeptide (TPR) repeat protein